ncbi:MAG: hypothetical protein ACO20H_03220 [Bacteriovoracaceae bacterium]
MKYLFMITTLFFALSCQEQKEGQNLVSLFKSKLPSGWNIELNDYNQAPFQWQGKNFVGKKIRIWKQQSKENVDVPYSEKSETYSSQKQMIRYLYEKMEGGYHYKMMERVHPDQLEVITNQYIIIAPSSMSLEKDVSPGKEIYKIYRDVLHKEIQKIEPINDDFFNISSFPKTLSGKKALIYDFNEGMYTSFGIYSP